MIRSVLASAAVALCCFLSPFAGSALADPPQDGFVSLFNGRDLEGWEVKGDNPTGEQWVASDGLLKAVPGGSWLSTKKMYENFVLRLEWRVPENGNSGVFLLVPDLAKGEQPHVKGIEVQVLDDHGPEYANKLKDWQYAGSIYGAVAAKNSPYKGAGEWNSFEITCENGRLTVVFNGQEAAQATIADEPALAGRPTKGYIGLQNHGTGAEFRNIQIKELPSTR